MKLSFVRAFFVILGLPGILAAQARPSTMPSDADPVIGPMRVENLVARNYLYVTRQVTLKSIGAIAGVEVPKLFATLKSAGIAPRSAMIFIFSGASADPNKTFSVEIGVPVDENAVAPAGYKIEKLPPTMAATILFSGAAAEIGQAYQELFPALFARGFQPTGSTREYYLYWESADSPNNVLLIAQEVK